MDPATGIYSCDVTATNCASLYGFAAAATGS